MMGLDTGWYSIGIYKDTSDTLHVLRINSDEITQNPRTEDEKFHVMSVLKNRHKQFNPLCRCLTNVLPNRWCVE